MPGNIVMLSFSEESMKPVSVNAFPCKMYLKCRIRRTLASSDLFPERRQNYSFQRNLCICKRIQEYWSSIDLTWYDCLSIGNSTPHPTGYFHYRQSTLSFYDYASSTARWNVPVVPIYNHILSQTNCNLTLRKIFYMEIVYDFYKEVQIQILPAFLALYRKKVLHLKRSRCKY